jgi:hypothetical protein
VKDHAVTLAGYSRAVTWSLRRSPRAILPARDPIEARELAARLRPCDIQPRLLRHGNDVFRGYRRTDFDDAFVRYLEPV